MKFDFTTHRCKLSDKGFDELPDSVIQLCENVLIFNKSNNVYVLCDQDSFDIYTKRITEFSEKMRMAVLRYIYSTLENINSVDDAAVAIWNHLKQHFLKQSTATELNVEIRSQNIMFCEETGAQWLEITLLDEESSGHTE